MNNNFNRAQLNSSEPHPSSIKRLGGKSNIKKRRLRLSTVILLCVIALMAVALCISIFTVIKLQKINLFSKSIILNNNYFLENSGYGLGDTVDDDISDNTDTSITELGGRMYYSPNEVGYFNDCDDYYDTGYGIIYDEDTGEVNWKLYTVICGADDELQKKLFSWVGDIRNMCGSCFDDRPWVYGDIAMTLTELYISGTNETDAVKAVCDKFGIKYDGSMLTLMDPPKKKQIDIPYLSQEGILPNGCESVSATMLLNYWGVDIMPEKFVDEYLYCKDVSIRWGVRYGPNPKFAYAGNPRSEKEGWGCFAPVIVRALNEIVPSDLSVKNLTGITLSGLKEYIDRDIPVAVWVTVNMGEVTRILQWKSEDGEETFLYPANEHCMVLVGYDEDGYIFADPYESNGIVRYSSDECTLSFNSLGRQAVAIVKR